MATSPAKIVSPQQTEGKNIISNDKASVNQQIIINQASPVTNQTVPPNNQTVTISKDIIAPVIVTANDTVAKPVTSNISNAQIVIRDTVVTRPEEPKIASPKHNTSFPQSNTQGLVDRPSSPEQFQIQGSQS